MDITGITPIEAAFETIGLTNGWLLARFLFFKSGIGLVFIVIGFLVTVWKMAKEGDYSYLANYFILVFCCWFIFLVPSSPRPAAASTVEAFSNTGPKYTGLTAEAIIAGQGGGDKVSLAMLGVSRFYNLMIIGSIKALDAVAYKGEYNYLTSPFLLNRVSLKFQSFFEGGIKDKDLREKIRRFSSLYYVPALTRIARQETQASSQLNGSSANVTQGYDLSTSGTIDAIDSKISSMQGKSFWLFSDDTKDILTAEGRVALRELQQEVYQYIDKNFPEIQNNPALVKVLTPVREEIKSSSTTLGDIGGQLVASAGGAATDIYNDIAKVLIGREASAYPYEMVSAQYKPDSVLPIETTRKASGIASGIFAWFQSLFAGPMAEGIINGQPFVQGYACLIMYSLFPFTLILCFLARSGMVLYQYFKYLFWVKSWSLITALIHYASAYIIDVHRYLTGSGFSVLNDRPYFNLATCIFLIMTPVVSLFVIEGTISGVGSIMSAFTLHVEKGVGAAKDLGGTAGKFLGPK